MPNQSFRLAPAVAEVAAELVEAHHKHLSSARVVYMFCSEPEKVRGQKALGTCAVKSGKDAWFITRAAGFEDTAMDTIENSFPEQVFIITIWEFAWNNMLSEAQRRALTDHELCHAWIEVDDKGNDVYKVVGHDIEEFNAVVKRHGPWRIEVTALLSALAKGPQLTFEEIAGVPPGAMMPMPKMETSEKAPARVPARK